MQIKGITSSIKKSLIEEMNERFDVSFGGNLVPLELAKMLLHYAKITGREMSVFITRKGMILELYIGDTDSVKSQFKSIRNKKIRCIHTHPKLNSNLSDNDLAFLKSADVESIIAISDSISGQIKASSAYNEKDDIKIYSDLDLNKINDIGLFSKIDERRTERTILSEKVDEVESVILLGSDHSDLRELKQLAITAGVKVLAIMNYNYQSHKGRSFIGTGKLHEVALAIQNTDADVVIFDDELKGSQIRNIEDELKVKVLDRNMLILDIFAKRAKSKEGKLQVLLAQLKYRSTHLTGKGTELSRLGAGIGTRGPGETKLETDRRHIKNQIRNIENELSKVNKTRNMHREERYKKNLMTVALVGYTNSGKSSLLNALTSSEVYVENKLFATLDTTTRKLELPGGRDVLLSDTVGFINKLPHELIEAFKATLEEVTFADLLLLVLDAKDPNVVNHQKVTYEILEEINAFDKPVISVLNKIDLTGHDIDRRIYSYTKKKTKFSYVSAKTGEGLDVLKKMINEILFDSVRIITEIIPYKEASRAALIHNEFNVISEEYKENGIEIVYEKTKNNELSVI